MEAELKIGDIVEAEVAKITDFGAFVRIRNRGLALIHISQISNAFVKDVNQHLKVGDSLKARVIKLGPGKKIDLSLKNKAQAQGKSNLNPSRSEGQRSGFKSSDFEEKLKDFLGSSL
jgi:predicted RNA-binding protein with RPS1 domain